MATNNVTHALEDFRLARLGAFRWRYQASLPWKITLALLMAGLTGLLAQVRIALPFTPVPLTGQTFAVLLAGVVLGRKWGGVSLAIYAILGVAGVPWFNGGTSGLSATGGYLIGFVLAALFLGYYTDKYAKSRRIDLWQGFLEGKRLSCGISCELRLKGFTVSRVYNRLQQRTNDKGRRDC